MTEAYTRDHERRIRAALRDAGSPRCPVCDVPLDVRRIQPRTDVSYVRRRRWLQCAVCGRALVVDDARETDR